MIKWGVEKKKNEKSRKKKKRKKNPFFCTRTTKIFSPHIIYNGYLFSRSECAHYCHRCTCVYLMAITALESATQIVDSVVNIEASQAERYAARIVRVWRSLIRQIYRAPLWKTTQIEARIAPYAYRYLRQRNRQIYHGKENTPDICSWLSGD